MFQPKRRVFSLFLLLALLSTAAQPGFAQSADGPLAFENNFFVTGDYVVGGAYNMNSNWVTIGGITYTMGTINVPDKKPGTNVANPGITGPTSVPTGAQIVAALLYWQTVEKVGLTPGQPGTGQNGFFRPVFNGGPQGPGYAISGVDLTNQSTVSFSFGGCTGGSTGKVVRTYRASVRGYLPQDANGNFLANGTYEVRLPSVGSSAPLTLGATLVIIYRVLSPKVPLNSIVIYDGAFAPGNALLNMTQTVQGFYDASHDSLSRVSRLTHIVGGGKNYKFQTVYLNNVPLPPMYASGQPFPGYYGGQTGYGWDNTTWTFPDPKTFSSANNPVPGGVGSPTTATTMVVPTTSNQGCVSWGAVIFSTTVQNTDEDGLLDAWKTKQGYCDAAVNEGKCNGPGDPAWVDLPGAVLGMSGNLHPDVFVQLDYMCSKVTATNLCDTTPGNYSFDPRLPLDPTDSNRGAIDKVVAAFASGANHTPITLHVTPTHAIQEPTCQDDPALGPCAFPKQPGVVGWKGGLTFIKNQLIDPSSGKLYATTTCPAGANCVPVFQHGKKDSYHYALFAHALGLPNWSLLAGTLANANPKILVPNVMQSGTTVTFETLTPHGLTIDPNCNINNDNNALGRVTVAFATTNPSLNGTHCVTSVKITNPANTAPDTFTITVANSVSATYTASTDPNLGVAAGQTGTVSGFSDVGGQDSLITLGSWGADGQTWQVKAGTFMHELGHTLGLTHGGLYYNKLSSTPNDYTPTFEANCKPNHLSVMSYSHQIDLLDKLLGFDQNKNPVLASVVDYSGQALDSLDKTSSHPLQIPPVSPFTSAPTYFTTSWYGSSSDLGVPSVNGTVGTPATQRCDGTRIPPGAPPVFRATDATKSLFWIVNQDINFDGNTTETLHGYNDWNGTPTEPGVILNQTGATGSLSASALVGGGIQGGSGGIQGGSGGIQGGSGGIQGGSGGIQGGGGGIQGGSGGIQGGSGGVSEITRATANSVTRPPRTLTASEKDSPRTITLNWTAPTFGQIGAYNVYRSAHGGPFTAINPPTVTGNPPATTFTDIVTCDPGGYRYFVTAVLGAGSTNPGQESVPSNVVSAGTDGALTGCYTLSSISSPASALHGSVVPLSWSVNDDFNTLNFPVNTLAANKSLDAIGPISPIFGACPTSMPNNPPAPISLLSAGTVQSAGSTFAVIAGQATFNLATDSFAAGCYFFKLVLDSGQSQTTASALQLQIDVTDTDNPRITTTAIQNGVVGTFYSNIISEHGGVTGQNPFTWTLANGSNPLPGGLSLGTASDGVSGLLSGIPSAAGMFSFTAQVTDSVGNIGMQTLTMTVTTPVAQINQPLVQDSSVPGAAAFVLTLNGTGFGPGSVVRWNGTPLVTTFIGNNKQLTAAIPGLDVAALGTASVSVSNPVTVGNKAVPNSNIDFFQISPTTSASLSRTDYPTGVDPNGLIAADFNGDGKLDLAIANSADNTVTILLGNGDGTFTAQPTLATGVGSGPQLPTAGDFNGDGNLDLAVANFVNNTVSVFLGNGNGTFQAPTTYAVANGPWFVITGDFNRDGTLDLAVASQNGQFVSILLGKGDGTFQPRVDYAAGGTAAPTVAAVALGDFDRDGKLDLAVTNLANDTVSVLRGNGDGTFQAPVTYSTGNAGDQPLAVSAVDLRGTGILDLAVTNVNARTVAILLGNGDGTFQPKVAYSTTSSASVGPGAIIAGDFNADGKVDLAITNQSANTVSILLGNGNGTLQNPLESATGTFAAGVAAGDFNGDGRLDLAVADLQANTVSIMLQRPEPASNVAVSGVTASQVSLTWTASASTTVVGYNVYRSTTQGGPYTKVNNSAIVAAPAFTDMSVASGTTYYYVVTAVDPGNLESVNSNEVSATTPPQPPTSLAVTNVTASQVTLTWTASKTASVVSYNVYRSTTSGVYTTPLASVNAGTSTYTDMTVAAGTTYDYVVTAVGPANAESVKSNEVSATTPPQPPTSLTVSGVATSQVSLSWTASTTASVVSYNVYRSTTPGVYTTPLASVNAAASTYTDMSVAAGTTYYYVVTAVGPANAESVKSNEVSATTPSAAVPPAAPTNLTAVVNFSVPSVALNWTASTSVVNSYNVYRKRNAENAFTRIASVSANSPNPTSYTDTAVAFGDSLHYYVTSVDSNNVESAPSNVVDTGIA